MRTPDDVPPPQPTSDAPLPVIVLEAPPPAPQATQLGLIEQVKAFWLALTDPSTSKLSKVAIGVAVLYIVSPIDLLPEALLAIFGLVDDMAAFGFLAHAVATLPTEAHRRAVLAQRGGAGATCPPPGQRPPRRPRCCPPSWSPAARPHAARPCRAARRRTPRACPAWRSRSPRPSPRSRAAWPCSGSVSARSRWS